MCQDQVFMCKWVIYGHEPSLNIQIHIIEQLNDNKIKHEAIGTKFHHCDILSNTMCAILKCMVIM